MWYDKSRARRVLSFDRTRQGMWQVEVDEVYFTLPGVMVRPVTELSVTEQERLAVLLVAAPTSTRSYSFNSGEIRIPNVGVAKLYPAGHPTYYVVRDGEAYDVV